MVITDINGNKRVCVKAYPDKDYPGFIKVEFKNERRSYNEWYPVDEFLSKNPDFNDPTKEIKHEALEIAGIVTSSTDITLPDKTQNWVENTYAGFPFSQYVLSRNIHEQMPALGNISHQVVQNELELKIKKIERDRKKVQKLIELDENGN